MSNSGCNKGTDPNVIKIAPKKKAPKHDFGDLNPKVNPKTSGKSFDTKRNTSIDVLKDVARSHLTDTSLPAGRMVGIVLRKLTDSELSTEVSNPVFANLGLVQDQILKLKGYKIRVPEFDAHLPEPETFDTGDPNQAATHSAIIDSHKTYVSKSEDCVEPTIGSLVWVELDNNVGFYLEPLTTETSMPATKPEADRIGGTKSVFDSSGDTPSLTGAKQKERTANEDQLAIWNDYTKHSGNPENVDLVTETVNGQKITLSRTTMNNYKKMQTNWNIRAKKIKDADLGEIPALKYKFGEALRVWRGTAGEYPGGKFRSGGQESIHNFGGAIDFLIPSEFKPGGKNSRYRKNWINLIVSTAQQVGFIRFGISETTIHMDNGDKGRFGKLRAGFWWIYLSGKPTFGAASKNSFTAKGSLTPNWEAKERNQPPPNLVNFNYLGVRYQDRRNIV